MHYNDIFTTCQRNWLGNLHSFLKNLEFVLSLNIMSDAIAYYVKAFQWIDWQYNWLTIYLMKTTLYQKQMYEIFTTIEILQHKECLKCLQEGKGKVESCWLTRWYFSAAPVYSSVSLRWWTNNQPYFFSKAAWFGGSDYFGDPQNQQECFWWQAIALPSTILACLVCRCASNKLWMIVCE